MKIPRAAPREQPVRAQAWRRRLHPTTNRGSGVGLQAFWCVAGQGTSPGVSTGRSNGRTSRTPSRDTLSHTADVSTRPRIGGAESGRRPSGASETPASSPSPSTRGNDDRTSRTHSRVARCPESPEFPRNRLPTCSRKIPCNCTHQQFNRLEREQILLVALGVPATPCHSNRCLAKPSQRALGPGMQDDWRVESQM